MKTKSLCLVALALCACAAEPSRGPVRADGSAYERNNEIDYHDRDYYSGQKSGAVDGLNQWHCAPMLKRAGKC